MAHARRFHRRAGPAIIPTHMKNIVILISGSGSNMAAIVKTAQREAWASRLGAQVAAVISNKADAKGLAFAKEQGIATAVLDHKTFASREAFDAALAALIDRYEQANEPVLVVLAKRSAGEVNSPSAIMMVPETDTSR